VTYKEIGDYEIANNISNIGKPIPTLSLYILDKHQKLLPNGIIGEIYVGGAGVARGYLGRKELTNTKFVVNPYNSAERLYRSGDLGRVLHSGDIEYLGRIDHQVQLRGFRVEMGEIESRLISHDKISEAVVIAKEKEGDKYLIAYYVSAEEISVLEMRTFLSAKLPDYMIPSYYIRMDGFLLTSNGKLDRKELPDPLIKIGDDFVAPSNEVEEKLIEIWAEVLKLDKGLISVNKSFFDLGGHSLKVILLTNEILAAFKVRISISEIFNCDSIAQMAKFIIEKEEINYELVIKSEVREYYKLSAAQQRIYFQQKLNPQTISYNIIGAFKIDGNLNAKKIENSFNILVDRNESLRTIFLERNGQVIQKILKDVNVKIEHINSSEFSINDDIRKLSIPFELDKFPLFRLVLAKISNDCHYLLINIHHIISDGVSVHLMFRDFIAIYNEEKLSETPFQYKDFSEWQNNYFTTPDYEKEKDFWLNKFKPQPPTLKIPLDFERPKIRNVDKGDLLTFCITGDRLKQLNLQVKSMNGTLFMYLFSIYNIFLHKISGMDDLTVGVLTNGRDNKAFQGILGMFVNTLPFRNKINTSETFSELFNQIKYNSIKYLSNQNFQLDELILAMGLQGKTEDSSLFNHLFNINMDNNMQVELSDLKVSNVIIDNFFAKFDLHLVADVYSDNIQMMMRYSTELFKKSTIEKYINYYNEILDQVLDNKNIKIEDIKISHNVSVLQSEINTDVIFQFE
jgi:acyl carrier protein